MSQTLGMVLGSMQENPDLSLYKVPLPLRYLDPTRVHIPNSILICLALFCRASSHERLTDHATLSVAISPI